ncbi:NADAR family protein [Hymenobacter sp. H14-R3]|uniref:NADAR family protein n=1 Tax=Hymenobacter sp. H14-R3 TaxID=3046308 RepID=UPI0024BAC198|nr:NADAR family protein [Hymenobacter sp. H14-R3]MDJ0363985.1 NADAR family protein [Hymenobacter sp. H14-R3]
MLLTYDLPWLIANFEKGKRTKFLFFWGHQRSKSGDLTAACFSQWWPAPFVVDGVRYATTEHWMMAQKALVFSDMEVFNQIMVAKSPAEAKALGRQVRQFDEATWTSQRMALVVRGNLAKFQQHPDLQEFILHTKERVLVEASPVDRIWGIGLAADSERAENPKQWQGLNLLGFALMEVRDQLRAPASGIAY